MFTKITQALMSRTTWVLILMFVVGGFEAVQNLIPADIYKPIFGVLTMLAIYFKVNPSQDYNR